MLPWLSASGWTGDWPHLAGWVTKLFPGATPDNDFDPDGNDVYPAQIIFAGGGSPGNLKPLEGYTLDVLDCSAVDAVQKVRDTLADILRTEATAYTRYTIRMGANILVNTRPDLMEVPGVPPEDPSEPEEPEEPTEGDPEEDPTGGLEGEDDPDEPDDEPAEAVEPNPSHDRDAPDPEPEEEARMVFWSAKGYETRTWQRVDTNAVAPPAPGRANGVFSDGRVPPPPVAPAPFQDPMQGSGVNPMMPSPFRVPEPQPQTSGPGQMPPYPAWNQMPTADPVAVAANPVGAFLAMMGMMNVTLLGEHRFLVEALNTSREQMLDMHRATMDALVTMSNAQINREREAGKELRQSEAARRLEEKKQEDALRRRLDAELAEERRRSRQAEGRISEVAAAVTGAVSSVEQNLTTRLDAVAQAANRRPIVQAKTVTERLFDKVGTLGEVVVDRVAAQVAAGGGPPTSGGPPVTGGGWVQRTVRHPDGTTHTGWFQEGPAGGGSQAPAPNGSQGGSQPGAPAADPMGDILKNPESAAAMLSLLSKDQRDKIIRAWALRDPEAAAGATEQIVATLQEIEDAQTAAGGGTDPNGGTS